MRLIRPVLIDDASLVSSNVPESEPVYAAGTTYAAAAQVRGNTTPTAHSIYESAQAGNVGHALTDPDWWIDTGQKTNRWKMFDASVTSQTENADSIAVELTTPGRVDSVALLNLDAASAQVVMTDSIDGVVFDETYSLVSPSGIIDWYAYFYEPIERLTELLVVDMPSYAGAEVAVTLDDAGGTAKCGVLVLGLSKEIGATQYGASVGIQDFSRKERNTYGDYVIVERAYARRANFTVWAESGMTDQILTLLASYRATPIVWVGSEEFGSTIVYGFYRDFSIELTYPTHSICTLELEGLT